MIGFAGTFETLDANGTIIDGDDIRSTNDPKSARLASLGMRVL
jgi:hypothetical protein